MKVSALSYNFNHHYNTFLRDWTPEELTPMSIVKERMFTGISTQLWVISAAVQLDSGNQGELGLSGWTLCVSGMSWNGIFLDKFRELGLHLLLNDVKSPIRMVIVSYVDVYKNKCTWHLSDKTHLAGNLFMVWSGNALFMSPVTQVSAVNIMSYALNKFQFNDIQFIIWLCKLCK